MSAARGVVFLTGGVVLWLALRGAIAAEWMLLPVGTFAALVVLHERVIRAKRLAERAVAHYERALARLDDRWVGAGASGARYLEGDDGVGEDLDLFGKGSLFELLSTARTGIGESTLADWLRRPAEAEEIRARQVAVDELRSRLDLREALALLGRDVAEGVEPAFLVEWAEARQQDFPAGATIAGVVLSALTTAGLVHWQGFGGEPTFFLAAAAAQAAFASALRRKADAVLHGFDRATRNLGLLAEILALLEREAVSAPRLVALVRSLETEGLPPSRRIAKLAIRADLLDSRKNQFFAPFAALLLWRTQLAISIARWRARHGEAVRRWVAAVGELEALLSFASHAFEHPAD
ncbi:MAG: MutS-related protein, partial [Candidatus Binatia bacterium]